MARKIQRRRISQSYVLNKSETYSVQPALFDVSQDDNRFTVSEASQGLTALGTGTGWKTMGKQYIDGEEIEPDLI